jgi:rod shape-determining protein MreB
MGFFTEEIAIDLGTANTLIIHNDKVVVDSPSIVAIDRTTNKVIAIGQEANMMQGKTHENIRTVRPLKDKYAYSKYSIIEKKIFFSFS